MFVGHYGVSFAVKRRDPSIPLWILFLAVQLLDVAWAPFVLLGIEKVRIVPGITRTNSLDLYYMPFTHSLVAALLWAAGAALLYRLSMRGSPKSAALVGIAVFSHWVLDFIVHRPDMPLYDNTAKVGLGLWNVPAAALGLEALLLLGGVVLCIRAGLVRPVGALVFGAIMLGVQVLVFFGPPPTSPAAAAVTALVAYFVFAAVIHFIERRPGARTLAT